MLLRLVKIYFLRRCFNYLQFPFISFADVSKGGEHMCFTNTYKHLLILVFCIYFSNISNILLHCIVNASVQPGCLNRKATDRNFLDQCIYPSGSWGVIETNMATNCFYEFVSALICTCTCAHWHEIEKMHRHNFFCMFVSEQRCSITWPTAMDLALDFQTI